MPQTHERTLRHRPWDVLNLPNAEAQRDLRNALLQKEKGNPKE